MAETWITFNEAFKSDPYFASKFIGLRPSEGVNHSLILCKDLTNLGISQNHMQEENISWNPCKIEEDGKTSIYLVSAITCSSIGLFGKIGSQNGINCLSSYARLYDRNSVNITGAMHMTADFLKKLPDNLRYIPGQYWLASISTSENVGDSEKQYKGLDLCNSGYISRSYLYNDYGEENYGYARMRIIIPVPEDLLVCCNHESATGKSPNHSLLIKRA